MKIVAALLVIFVSYPIWFYLLYRILVSVNASELMFFLFWIYLPVSLFAAIVGQILKEK